MDSSQQPFDADIRSAALHLGNACQWQQIETDGLTLQRGEQNWQMQIAQFDPYQLLRLLPQIVAVVQHGYAAGVTQAGTQASGSTGSQPAL